LYWKIPRPWGEKKSAMSFEKITYEKGAEKKGEM
jgi:hypothetical protein